MRDQHFLKCLLHDDLQAGLLIDLLPSCGVLGEVSFDLPKSIVVPVLMFVTSQAHEDFIRKHLVEYILKCQGTPGHPLHEEAMCDDLQVLYPNLFSPLEAAASSSDEDSE